MEGQELRQEQVAAVLEQPWCLLQSAEACDTIRCQDQGERSEAPLQQRNKYRVRRG